jgi:uncharacterized protein YjbI with pentapeptide repeats
VRRIWQGSGRAATAGLIVAGLVLFGWVWWKLPPALYREVAGDARIKAITDTRTALLAGLVGLGAIGTFWVNSRTYRVTARTFELTEQGHITERYTKAIEQLGSTTSLDVRLGGIYALERIAVDSARDHATVVEVLSAYVREHGLPEWPKRQQEEREGEPSITEEARPRLVPTDVRAALTVLGRLPFRAGISRGDLSGAPLGHSDLHHAVLFGFVLSGADLSHARLEGADLSHARLEGADLSHARLEGADLSNAWLHEANLSGAGINRANLSHAMLAEANLSNALLYSANLSHALLYSANLSHASLAGAADLSHAGLEGANLSNALLYSANLSHARLEGANLSDARLFRANLSHTRLEGADLSGAWLSGVDLSTTENLSQAQLDSARGDTETALPPGRRRPAAHWLSVTPESDLPEGGEDRCGL